MRNLISVGSDRNCRMDFFKGKKKQLPILVYRILALNLYNTYNNCSACREGKKIERFDD